MPKRKPDQVIAHRIELQETERDVLKAYLAGRTATNAVSAVGSIIAPFGALLGAAATAYFALYTAEEIVEAMNRAVADTQQYYARNTTEKYQEFTAFLQGNNWNDFELHANMGHTLIAYQELSAKVPNQKPYITLRARMSSFMAEYIGKPIAINAAKDNGWNPAETWANFYPIEECINDSVHERGGITNTVDFIFRFLNVQGWYSTLTGDYRV